MLDLSKKCIESSTDYSKFKRIVGNRSVSQENVKRLTASMQEQQLASIGIVNKDFFIIDGQHRHAVCEALGIPFNYIIMEDYGIEEVHTLNSNMKNWSNEDYVRQFSDRYNQGEHVFDDYNKLVIFMDTNNLKLNEALLLLEGGIKSGTVPLRAGVFKITESIVRVSENLEYIIELEKILGSNIVTQSFWQVFIMSNNIDKFNAQRFVNKVKRGREDLENCKDTFKSLNETFEEVYNFNQRSASYFAFAHINTKTYRDRKNRLNGDKNDG